MWRGDGKNRGRRSNRHSVNIGQMLKKRRKQQRPPLRLLAARSANIHGEVASISALDSGPNLRYTAPMTTTSSSSGSGYYAAQLARQPAPNHFADDLPSYSAPPTFNPLASQPLMARDARFIFDMEPTSGSTLIPDTQSRPVFPETWNMEDGRAAFINVNWRRFVLDVKHKNGVYDAVDGIMDPSAQFSVVTERFARERGLSIMPMFPGTQWKSPVTPLGVQSPIGYVTLELKSTKHNIPKMKINVLVVDPKDLQASEVALTNRFDVFFGSAFVDKLEEKGQALSNTTAITNGNENGNYSILNDMNANLPPAEGLIRHNYGGMG